MCRSNETPAYWVTAVVTETVPLTFSAVMGRTSQTVSARATAAGFAPSDSGGCVFTLEPTQVALTADGNGTIRTGCGVYVNSVNNAAVTLAGNSSIVVENGTRVRIRGGWRTTGNGTFTPEPQTGVPQETDPFAELEAPSIGSCTGNGVSLASSQTSTLQPGVHCGSISLTGQSSLTLAPGLHIITGNISVAGGTSITGTGVTIYLTSGGISFTGGSLANLSAPTSPANPYQGILIFQARNNSSLMNLSGGLNQLLTGVIYAPASHIDFSGNASAAGTSTTMVSRTLRLVGNGYIKTPATTRFTGGGTGIGLLE